MSNKFRIGHGYDVHRLCENRKLILCGVEIGYERGLLGHSDADVAVHALMDAILGAAGMGDIGTHFPPEDMSYKDISSISLLKRAAELISREGYQIGNIDITIIAECPMLKPYIQRMREALSGALGLETGDVSVKATTEEGLGFTGSGEGIAAHAVCVISRI
ncbi:MAG: 2-C-methyl-D-erythritol 2,4-cyclodiphosphate synthase [Oscillospiraceae bacterium]|jgi:2-C-methyl-D-erythritol 2,4-cyclodiphosphate synthase|nr:2-C-methyl-D-erythritol 2,4-cyclodiphosphate synthase [Oscillospiraceae bacterium]